MKKGKKLGFSISFFAVIFAILVTALVAAPTISADESGGYVAWDGKAATRFAGGSGEKDNPFQISTPAQLKFFANSINKGNYSDSYFVLTNDIYYNDPALLSDWMSGTNSGYIWIAAGSNSKPFSGSFDGAGHTIYGLYLSNTSSYQGFIGRAKYGLIKDLTIDSSFIKGGSNTGAIVGYLGVSTDIINCVNYATVIGRGQSIGGIAGGTKTSNISETSASRHEEANSPTFRILNCKNYGDVINETGTFVGGIIGYIGAGRSRATIADCENYGKVSSAKIASHIGGIVGGTAQLFHLGHNTVERCVNYGEVSGVTYIGGIVGCSNETEIFDSYNYGSVKASGDYAGGIAGGTTGYHYTDRVDIDACINFGMVEGETGVGGIVGKGMSTNVYRCVNRAEVNGDANIGGVAGMLGSELDALGVYCEYNYNIGDISGGSNVAGIAGISYTSGKECSHINYCYNIGSATNGITNGNEVFFSMHDNTVNYFIGSSAKDGTGVDSLAFGKGFASTKLADCGEFTAGMEYPLISDVPAHLQAGDAEKEAVTITSAEVRYDRQDRGIGMRVFATVTNGDFYNEYYGAVSLGIVAIPSDMLYLALNIDTDGALVVPAKWMYEDEGDTVTYNAVITEIPEEAYLRDIVFVAYAEVDGGYVYSEPATFSYSEVAIATAEKGVTDESVLHIASAVEFDVSDAVYVPAATAVSYYVNYTAVADVNITITSKDRSIAAAIGSTNIRGFKAGSTAITVTAESKYGSRSIDIPVYVGESEQTPGGGDIIVNQFAPKDNVCTLYCNELEYVATTISKNDGFIFDYNGHILMYDSGNKTDTALNYLLEIRERYMRAAGFSDLEIASPQYKLEYTWILSHYHGDHYGSMESSLYNSDYVMVKEAYFPASTRYNSKISSLIGLLKKNNNYVVTHTVNFSQVVTVELTSDFTVDILGSVYNWNEILGAGTDGENSSSMWARVTCNGRGFLLTGDTYVNAATVGGSTTNGVKAMVDYYSNLNGKNYLACDVIKSMHHGRLTYSTALFDLIQPDFTICSVYFAEEDTRVVQDAVKYGDVILLDVGVYFKVDADGRITCSRESAYERNDNGYIIKSRAER